MTYIEHLQQRQEVINFVYKFLNGRSYNYAPSYKTVVTKMNAEGFKTARGNVWTEKRLLRLLQNSGISGIWGLSYFNKPPAVPNKKRCRFV